MTANDADKQAGKAGALPEIKVPALLTFAGLVAGIVAGLVLPRGPFHDALLAVAGPLGTLWLKALKMTIVPLVAGLLFTGVLQAIEAARAGPMARRTMTLFVATLAASAVTGLLAAPTLLALFPIPLGAAQALASSGGTDIPAPVGAGEFIAGLVPENVFAAASGGAMVPLVVFIVLFALATGKLDEARRQTLGRLFEALAAAMMVVIGWVLAVAPIGVFSLALGMTSASGSAVIATLAHYIAIVSSVGLLVTLGAYFLAWLAGGQPLSRFARALLPSQTVAVSTQSSLASLPAMIVSCRRLGLKDASDEFVLPLAVALYKATSPAMNLAVIYYIARLSGLDPDLPTMLAAGALAVLCSIGIAGVASAASFFVTLVPISLAMGAPLAPLGVLIAVEMLPDIVRTLGNVTMNVAVTSVIDRRANLPEDQK
ncbi:MAG: cation:dicarboxylase symporter family transporter [Novosphingobium sp.]|nr:cation:dicarboxylase symporter family transporter [Novosphingobium sp.]